MGNDGFPTSLAILIAVVTLGALGFMAYVVATVISLGAPAG